MTYKCCNCDGLFPTKEAIDGYKQGYTKGFLCPLCNANIISDRFKYGHIYSGWVINVLLIILIAISIWNDEIEHQFGINWVLLSLFIIAIGGAVLFKSNKGNSDIFHIYTRFVNKEDKTEKERTKQPWEQ